MTPFPGGLNSGDPAKQASLVQPVARLGDGDLKASEALAARSGPSQATRMGSVGSSIACPPLPHPVVTERARPWRPLPGSAPAGHEGAPAAGLSESRQRSVARPEVSHRRACRVVGRVRSTQRYDPVPGDFEVRLVKAMRALGEQQIRIAGAAASESSECQTRRQHWDRLSCRSRPGERRS